MAKKTLRSEALSTFCGSVATMMSAGIQMDEAMLMLAENRERSFFQEVCKNLYHYVVSGDSLSIAMQKSDAFPAYAVDMVSAGERAGHVEQILRNLELYYDEQARLFTKLRSSVGYPAALLVIMSIILAFTVVIILPIFNSVYDSMAGSLANASFFNVNVATAIGWVALVIMLVLAVGSLVLVAIARTPSGQKKAMDLLSLFPQTRQAMYQLSLSRFTSALATLVASGIDDQEALQRATATVNQPRLHRKLEHAIADMNDVDNPLSLMQAIEKNSIFDPLYARMLNVGIRSGNADGTLAELSTTFFEDSVVQIDRAFDHIEPMLAALLTVAVGATLVAVMLPLIGIMSSIG